MSNLSLYFHWPFCASKCPYCDFNVHVTDQIDTPRWTEAYLKSIRHYARLYKDRKIISIFFGGGTPSLMPPEMIKSIIDEIYKNWKTCPDVEITLEANPTSVEIKKLESFRTAGVNRVSLGVQALNDTDLTFLGRAHDATSAITAIKTASSLFDKFSFDLIYARPNQTLSSWQSELEQAAELAKGHLSLYQLTIERKTPFYLAHARGEFYLPEEDLAADFYHLTYEYLATHGLPAYETSNYAALNHRSRHNMVYWQYGDYVGIGPGSHGRLTSGNMQRLATRDHYAPEKWLEWVERHGYGAHENEVLDTWDQVAEAIMMGLRLYDGINLKWIGDQIEANIFDYIDQTAINRLASEGWLCYEDDTLKPSPEGMLRLNSLITYLIQDKE